MELLDGLDLNSLVERYGPLPVERTVFLLTQIGESLAEAHHQGLIHRDVKPANIFVCQLGLKYDYAKVLDFGLVKGVAGTDNAASKLTVDGKAAGSPAFMAPETAEGTGEADSRVDIYALGCVAYWMLSGQLVFEGGTALQIALAHVQKPPPKLTSRAEIDIPTEIEQVVMSCLEKDPDMRPQSISEFCESLAKFHLKDPWTNKRAENWWNLHKPTAGSSQSPTVGQMDSTMGEIEKLDGELAAEATPADMIAAREQTLHVLQHHFAHSTIGIEELEKRTEKAEYAKKPEDLQALMVDLPSVDGVDHPLLVPNHDAIVKAHGEHTGSEMVVYEPPSARTIAAVFSGAKRKGVWQPAQQLRVITFMGGADLDFRQAKLQPGCTEIRCFSLFGGVSITVPPDLFVEVNGVAVFGGFEHRGEGRTTPPINEPYLRVGGMAVFGGVEVKVKEPTERRRKGKK